MYKLLKNATIIITIPLITLIQCSKKTKLNNYTVKYSKPYYAVNLKNETLIFSKPNHNANITHKLKANRIVKLKASVSLENKNDIWYLLSETDFKGYAKPQHFKLFENITLAENFIKQQFPKIQEIKASLPLYTLAYNDFKKNNLHSANIKLYRFLNMNKNLITDKPPAYYTTMILIGNIYIKQKEYQKALLHFQNMKTANKYNYMKLISQKTFNPKENIFPVKNITEYITSNKTLVQKTANLNWELLCYLAFIYEKKQTPKKAMQIYKKLIQIKKISNVELPYINFIIDRISIIKSPDYLLKLKTNTNTSHRYMLFKIASISEKKQKLNNALKYYKLFIKLFEKKYHKNPYPNETLHYIQAKETIKNIEKN